MNSISTRRGDTGETGLLYGGRVEKSDHRIEAAGQGDFAVSALGWARACCDDEWVRGQILDIQLTFFTVNAQLATHRDSAPLMEEHFITIDVSHIDALDALLAELEAQVELPPSFIIPGASKSSAAIDLARTAVRTVERHAVRLHETGTIDYPHLIRWLNRLSDCLFMLARYVDRDLPTEIVTGTRR